MTFKKILWRLSMSLMAQTILAPASLAANYEVTPNMRTCAVVRKRASVRADRMDCLQAGAEVKVISYNPRGYSEVSINGKRRYVWGKFLTKVEEQVSPPSSGPTKRYVKKREPVPSAPPAVAETPAPSAEAPPAPVSDDDLVSQTPFGPQNPRGRKKPSIKAEPAPVGESAAPVAPESVAAGGPVEEVKQTGDIPEVAPTNDGAIEIQSTPLAVETLGSSAAKPDEVAAKEVEAQPAAEPASTDASSSTKGPAPMCGGKKVDSPDMWTSVASIAKEGIIPPKNSYDINGGSWPKLLRQGDKLVVEYGPNKKSMCTSATATAFFKHIADLANSGAFTLTDEQLDLLNRKGESRREVKAVYNKKTKKTKYVSTGKIIKPGPDKTGIFKNALNGDTNSMALLYEALGGSSVSAIKGQGGDRKKILAALKMAKPGDILKIDHRTNGKNYGHSTIFKELKGDKVCYWSSSPRTKGAAEDCKPIANLIYVAVSRLPADVCEIPKRLDQLLKDPGRFAEQLHSSNAHLAPNWVAWKSSLPESPDAARVVATEESEAGSAR